MIDWLLRPQTRDPVVRVGERELPLDIRRRAQARRLTMRLAPDGSAVQVTMPRWGRTADALAFAQGKTEWLEAQLARLPTREELAHGSILSLHGEALLLHHDPRQSRRVRLHDGALHVGGPSESLRPRLARWLEGEARRALADDLAHYCAKAGVPPARLMLSRAQRRWGSCSGKGEIRINWRLVMAPVHVRRSVVAHEVTHLVHFDHSPRFHAFLADLFEGDIEAANRWLKAQGRSLYAPFG